MSALATRAAGAGFTQAQLDSLFEAILIDDEVDAETPLPERIELDFAAEMLADIYRISRQLWTERVDPAALADLIRAVARDGDLARDDRVAFKHVRAKLKHLRFAFALVDTRHRYPPVMDWTTTALGHLQDAFKTGQRGRARREAALCLLLLSPGPRAALRREQNRIVPADTADFRGFVQGEIAGLAQLLAEPMLTGAGFHAGRKIASRLVAFWSTLHVIAPSERAHRMTRALAAINGTMGTLHDDLIARRIGGMFDYHADRFALPDEIGARIAALVDRHRVSGLFPPGGAP